MILTGQQDHTLYFQHHVPQVNFLNPAVQSDCKIYIGIPVLSSIHFNLAHNGFTFNQLFTESGDGTYSIDAPTIEKKIGKRNYLNSEIYINLFAFGIKINNYYFTLAVREKNDLAQFYTEPAFSFIYNGNSQFEGKYLNLTGNGINFNHFREFSLGVSKEIDEGYFIGIRGKILFGKLNANTSNSKLGLLTEENTFNLHFDGLVKLNSSLPAGLEYDNNGDISIHDNYYTSPANLILNRKNRGIAFDAGFIYPYDENLTFSGSILDLGFISYRSNLTRYRAEGVYTFDGFLGDTALNEQYVETLLNEISDAVEDTITQKPYLYVLSPRVYAGVTKQINPKLKVNGLLALKIYNQTIMKGLTISSDYKVTKSISASLSWSYMHRSINNIGAAVVIGKNPIQFYIASDNVIGWIWPQSTKNLNACFGLNILLGCKMKRSGMSTDECGCYWIKQAEERNERDKNLKKRIK